MFTFVRLKRIIAILLLILFAYGTIGYYISFEVEKTAVRHEIKQRIKQGVPTSDLTIIKDDVTNSRLNWIKPSKEFRLNGKMYDVVSKRIEGNIIYYSCINDTQEEELFKTLDEQVNKEMNNTDSETRVKTPLKDYIPAERFTPKQAGVSFMSNPLIPNIYQPPYPELETPPPPFQS